MYNAVLIITFMTKSWMFGTNKIVRCTHINVICSWYTICTAPSFTPLMSRILCIRAFSLHHIVISTRIYTGHHCSRRRIVPKLWICTRHISKSICAIAAISHVRNVPWIRRRSCIRPEITASGTVVCILVVGMIGRICAGSFGGAGAVRHTGRCLGEIGESGVGVHDGWIRHCRWVRCDWRGDGITRDIAWFIHTCND